MFDLLLISSIFLFLLSCFPSLLPEGSSDPSVTADDGDLGEDSSVDPTNPSNPSDLECQDGQTNPDPDQSEPTSDLPPPITDSQPVDDLDLNQSETFPEPPESDSFPEPPDDLVKDETEGNDENKPDDEATQQQSDLDPTQDDPSDSNMPPPPSDMIDNLESDEQQSNDNKENANPEEQPGQEVDPERDAEGMACTLYQLVLGLEVSVLHHRFHVTCARILWNLGVNIGNSDLSLCEIDVIHTRCSAVDHASSRLIEFRAFL